MIPAPLQCDPTPTPTPGIRHPAPDYARTLDEVAGVLGLSRERVRQIEARALRKLRHALERRGISEQEWLDYLQALPTTERVW